jgi:predicted negative regulator of RcsB-dependent stress response
MSVLALGLVARPLFKMRAASPTLIFITAFVAVVSVGVYFLVGHRTWQQDEELARAEIAVQHDMAANIQRLEQHVREHPNDTEAVIRLAEILVEQDQRAVVGRAGELFELALKNDPNNIKALWYGAIIAVSTGKLPLARERLQRILAQNPPENIRSIIDRQIQDISQQLGEAQASASLALKVEVALKPGFGEKFDKATPLFILARDPVKGGPPLAATRRTVGDLPLIVTLTDNDAMMAGRGISSVPRVQVVARISKSGTPQAQAGDLFGDAIVDLSGKQSVAVKIAIDRKVEK